MRLCNDFGNLKINVKRVQGFLKYFIDSEESEKMLNFGFLKQQKGCANT